VRGNFSGSVINAIDHYGVRSINLGINIKMDLKEIECGLDLCGSKQGSVTGFCVNGNTSVGSILGGEFLDDVSDY
jgi:hypothetical protein